MTGMERQTEYVVEMLKRHKEAKARLESIDQEILWARQDAEEYQNEPIESKIGSMMLSQNLSGMPEGKGGLPLSKVEKCAESIENEEAQLWAKAWRLTREKKKLERQVRRIETALNGLYDYERFVVENSVIESRKMDEIATLYEEKYKKPITERHLRGIKGKGIGKIISILYGIKIA